MASNNTATKSVTHQIACQVCGILLEQDPSLDKIDDQTLKRIESNSNIYEESYNDLQSALVDDSGVIRKELSRKRLSQSSIDSTNSYAFLSNDQNKESESKNMRKHRDDINVHEKLFDFLSEQCTFDHPLCQECTETLLDKLDIDLQMAIHESASYKKLLEDLNSKSEFLEEDVDRVKQELPELDEKEKQLREELAALEIEDDQIQRETEELQKKDAALEAEENKLLREYNEQKRLLFEAEDEQKNIDNQIKHALAQHQKLSKTNAFNAAFHIWHQEHFGTINGFRLGRLVGANVEDAEINAGLGQTALLLNSLAKRIDLQFTKYQNSFTFEKRWSHSYIEDLTKRENDKPVQLPLYTPHRYFNWSNQFDEALIAFLDCVNQFKSAIETKNQRFCLPYKMNEKNRGIITDNNGNHFSIKCQNNSPEQWTKALKYLLTNLKWGLTWISSQLPDDMTTSNIITSPASPMTSSPR